MSGDFGPRVTIPAAIRTLQQYPDLSITLVGEPQRISAFMPASENRLRLCAASEMLSVDARPSDALRKKRTTSLGRAIGLLADKQVDGCVSAGNAGAIMGLSKSELGVFDGIERPAICAALPTQGGKLYMLDLGANVDCTAHQLLQFALMGSALAAVDRVDSQPRVGLLNIGSEAIKGNKLILEAAELFKSASANQGLNYQGYVEANQLLFSDFDVVVSDGFYGNVALKALEGAAQFVAQGLKAEFKKGFLNKCRGLFAKPALQQWYERYNPARLNGATLLGLPSVVVKSHGDADELAFAAAIGVCYSQIKAQVPAQIKSKLAQFSCT